MKTGFTLTVLICAVSGAACAPALAGTSACCHPDGSCSYELDFECASIFPGVFFPGENCDVSCFGACSLPDGRCADTDAWSCQQLGGSVLRGDACCRGQGPSGTPSCGDYNADNKVDWIDFYKLQKCMSTFDNTCATFDFDHNGKIDLKDYSVLAWQFQPKAGCTIEGHFYEPNAQGAFPRNCTICRPQLSRSTWTPANFGEVCNPGSGDLCDQDEYCNGWSEFCPEDIVLPTNFLCRLGSGDVCDPDEYCPGVPDQPCPPDIITLVGTTCRPGVSNDICDYAEHCPGTPGGACPPNVYASSDVICRFPTSVCDEAEHCPGVPGQGCLPDTGLHCPNGQPCGSDGLCISGSCNGGVCGDGTSVIGGPCDSDPDCSTGFICDNGACLAAFDTFCVEEGQCASGLMCDAFGTGRCKRAVGSACTSNSQCGQFAPCTNGACRLDLNQPCTVDNECASGNCHCALQGIVLCDPGLPCPPQYCITPGVCKLRLGDACTDSAQCPPTYRLAETTDPDSTEYSEIAPGRCRFLTQSGGVCEPGLYVIGTVCETNPPGTRTVCSAETTGGLAGQPCSSSAECPGGACSPRVPQIFDSPNDGLCGSGICFRGSGGEDGPCTPASVCSSGTTGGLAGQPCNNNADCPGGSCLNQCGGPANPPDYKCCRNDNGVCSTDFDCCGRFGGPPSFDGRMRGCKSPNAQGTRRCGPLSLANEPCTTTLDCLRRGDLTCQNGVCVAPFVPPVLVRGSECNPGNPNGYCEPGTQCLNCNPEGRGYRCVDSSQPCCNSGGYDEFFCGNTYLNDISESWTNSCCNYKCYRPNHVNACGGCGTNCVDPQNVCVVPGSEQCTWTGSSYRCSATEDEQWCPDDPQNFTRVNACVPDGPGTFHCWEYTDYSRLSSGFDDLIVPTCRLPSVVDGLQCTAESQCADCFNSCHCRQASSGGSFNIIFAGSRCECDP